MRRFGPSTRAPNSSGFPLRPDSLLAKVAGEDCEVERLKGPTMSVRIPTSARPIILAALMATSPLSGDPAVGTNPGKTYAPICSLKYYPPAAIAACETGTAIVNFYIGVDGRTSDVRVLQSTGYADLDEATKACIADWRYRPATQNGEPIGARKAYKIDWSLGAAKCVPANATPPPSPEPNS